MTDVRPHDPFFVTYQVCDEQLHVTLVNTGQQDILVEVPSMGLEYSVEYEMLDGIIDEFTNGRSVHLAESNLRLVKRGGGAQWWSPNSTLSLEIPWQDSTKAVKRLKVIIRYINISDLHSVRSADALERLLFRNERAYVARLATPSSEIPSGGVGSKF